MEGTAFIFIIIILLISIVIHEVAHGYAADYLGDPTPRLQGRLTLNPVSHFDLFGSFIIPVTAYFLGGFIFGWAKPVPYNPHNLRSARWGEAIVAGAGPLTNIIIAIVFGLAIRFAHFWNAPEAFVSVASIVVLINIIIALFNLTPIPPLDGSKILFSILPMSFRQYMYVIEQFGLFLVLIFIFTFWRFIFPFVGFLFHLITGVNFL